VTVSRRSLISGALAALPAAKRPSVNVPPATPRAEDVSSIDGMIRAFYDVISGPAGAPRQWSRDRTLYIPDVRFVEMTVDKDGKPRAIVMSHQEFVDNADPELWKNGFFEAEIHRQTVRFGNIAHVLSTYESKKTPDGKAFARGINSIELFWDGARWFIAGAIWDSERKDNPIPKELLPA